MIFDDICKDVINSFGTLWKINQRGSSIEIVTPFVTTSHQFISVFLSERDNKYVISDGGWITDGVYDITPVFNSGCFIKIFEHYLNSFDIKNVSSNKNLKNKFHFYKSTQNSIAIPSLVMDVANFISVIVSVCAIEFGKEEDNVVFKKTANGFLSDLAKKDSIDFQGYLDQDKKMIRLSAIITKSNMQLVLINYISGNSSYQFTNSVARASLMFEMADKSKYNDYIKEKVSLVNDDSLGYRDDSSRLSFTLENRHSKRINWSKRSELKALVK